MDIDFDSPESILFADLKKKTKSFQEKFESLLKDASVTKLRSDSSQIIQEIPNEQVEELVVMSKKQQETQKVLLKKHKGLTDEIENTDRKIKMLTATFAEFKKEHSVRREDLKQEAKPLIKAIKKYSKHLDMKIEVLSQEQDNLTVSVTFSEKHPGKPVKFVIDMKRRCVKDVQADTVLSEEEVKELKVNAINGDSLDTQILLRKLRDCCRMPETS